jgi:hypothetical protein
MYRDPALPISGGGIPMELEGWVIAVLLIIGAVLTLNHLGVDVGPAMASAIRGSIHFLGQPL